MIEAGLWGLIGASSLLLGAVLALVLNVPPQIRGLVLAFGAGTLLGAVAYELVEEALGASITGLDVALGFGLGAGAFFTGSVAIDRMSGSRSADGLPSRRTARSSGLALVLGSVLDGIPESVVLGLSFAPGAGVALPILVAIFLSNVPEGLSGTEDLSDSGISRARVLVLWAAVVVAGAVFAGLGYAIGSGAPQTFTVVAQAFAAGAILAMLAESMFPEAHALGGRAVGLATALGVAVAAYLSLKW